MLNGPCWAHSLCYWPVLSRPRVDFASPGRQNAFADLNQTNSSSNCLESLSWFWAVRLSCVWHLRGSANSLCSVKDWPVQVNVYYAVNCCIINNVPKNLIKKPKKVWFLFLIKRILERSNKTQTWILHWIKPFHWFVISIFNEEIEKLRRISILAVKFWY